MCFGTFTMSISLRTCFADGCRYSHESNGGCSEGPYAVNFTASPYSFPDGLQELGIPMMLFLQGFNVDNIYSRAYAWSGQSVAGKDASRFFTDRFDELTSAPSQCSALTLDGLAGVYYSDPPRYTSVDAQEQYDRGLSDAALAHKLPIRIDQQSPSDILASVLYGARTVGRCTYDANPCPGRGATGPWAPRPGPCYRDSRWSQLVGAAVLLRAVGMRPFTDVIWTTSIQSADPRWGVGARRPTVVHDLLVATLSTGPVGFGDLVNGTDAVLLSRAVRKDGTILKPASTALRVDRYYRRAPIGGAEIWAAVTGPAGSSDSTVDSRANSMAMLDESKTDLADDDLWWWVILATNVDGRLPNGAALRTAELWPTPSSGVQFLVATVEHTAEGAHEPSTGTVCANGALASSCLTLWNAERPLDVGTSGVQSEALKNFSLFAAAPVLANGWVLLGDMSKFVPCSPQRCVRQTSN